MRIDKYLKLTRLVRRRTVAKELLDRDIFTINGKIAKPSSEVNIGDILVLKLGRHQLTVEVTNILPYVTKDTVNSLYVIKEDKIIEDED